MLESAFQYAYEWLWRNLAQSMQHDLRIDAYLACTAALTGLL